MNVEILDRDNHLYRCHLGEFTDFPTELPNGAPPRLAAFSHWSASDPRLQRRTVDGVKYVDVDHAGQIWTYELDRAWTASPAERIPALYELPEQFDVGRLAD